MRWEFGFKRLPGIFLLLCFSDPQRASALLEQTLAFPVAVLRPFDAFLFVSSAPFPVAPSILFNLRK